MKNTLLSRQNFNEMTASLGKTLQQLAFASHLSDNEVYEMVMSMINSFTLAVVPTKEEN